jgi:2-polyprenyl-3-methyl-5-hydroxy-6-metoxy-1,4-benzoquinol methylase
MSNTKCRFCQYPLRHTFVDLGMSPLSNSYLKASQLHDMEPFYPLHARVCEHCFLVQVDEARSAQDIFSDYAYFSSYSDSWLHHAKTYCQAMIERFKLDTRSKVIEIASNDGYLLQYFVERNIPVLGVEPAANIAHVAVQKGVPTVCKFFGIETAHQLVEEGQEADLVLGNNVLAHVPDLNDFVGGLRILVKEEGLITLEFPHLQKLISLNQFDTIYHEHFSYLSLMSVLKIFQKHRLYIFDVEELPTHGGSLRIYASKDQTRKISPRVKELEQIELAAGMNKLTFYTSYSERVRTTKRNLLGLLIDLKSQNKRIVGYGAPAKGNTLLNYCGIRGDFVDFTVDRSPYKQGHFLPGTHIPIKTQADISESRPDYVLILPWNLKEEIMEQLAFIRDWGGKFIVPIPNVEVLT